MKSFNLIDLFDENIKRPPSTSKGRSFKPSALGTKCLRKLYYSANRVPEDFGFSKDLSRIGRMGDAVHDMLKDTYRKAKIMIDYYPPEGKNPNATNGDMEFPISDTDLEINKGLIDAIFVHNGKLYIGEFKSINSRGFDSLHAPKEEHIVQAIIYLYVFNRMLAEGKYSHIKELDGHTGAVSIVFLYVNKDNSQMKEFEIGPNDNLFVQLLERINYIKGIDANSPLPPKTPEWCQSCQWRTKCAKDQKN